MEIEPVPPDARAQALAFAVSTYRRYRELHRLSSEKAYQKTWTDLQRASYGVRSQFGYFIRYAHHIGEIAREGQASVEAARESKRKVKPMYVKVSDLPSVLQRALASMNYGKRDIGVEARERVSMQVAGGDGRRGFAILVDLPGDRFETHLGSWGGANMFAPTNSVDLDGTERDLPPNGALITGTTGAGTYGTYAVLTLHPSNVVKFLPAGPELSQRERAILRVFKGIKPSYRRDELRREGIELAETDLDGLAAKGLVKRSANGATQITTEGKNAVARET